MRNINSLPIKNGEFSALSAVSGIIASGVTGDILTVTPPAGQRVRLTHLSTGAGFDQNGISILFGTTTVLSEKFISGPAPDIGAQERFSIGKYQPYAAGIPPNGNHPFITGKVDEALVINKNSGNTTRDIYYAYEFGE